MVVEIERLAESCKAIINSPEENIEKLREYVNSSDEITLISVLKVFKNIIPTYKIDVTQNRIKNKKKHLPLKIYEKSIYDMYKSYVNNICKSDSKISFLIAIELLDDFDHFNFAEKILNKILKGTARTDSISKKSVDIIVKKVGSDSCGNLTFKVLIELLTFDYCDDLYACIADLAIIRKIERDYYSDADINKNTLYDSKSKESDPKNSQNAESVLKNYKKKSQLSRKEKKINFQLSKIRKACGVDESKEKLEYDKKMYRTIVENLMRIYFIILKEKKTTLYINAFIGLQKYKKLIYKDFHDGLVIMLDESMALPDRKISLYAASCYMGLFGDRNLEFKSVVNCLYKIIVPLENLYDSCDYTILKNILENLFIRKKQPSNLIHVFIHKIFIFLSLQYSEILFHFVKELIGKYDIDLYDAETEWPKSIMLFNENCHDVHNFPPFFTGKIFSHYKNLFQK